MSAFSRELLSFVEIARHKSVRRAAEVLNVAPSALIRQIQMLERAFGVQLMVRTPKGSVPTTAGRELLEHANQWIDAERRLKITLTSPNTTILRIGVMECLLPFIRSFQENAAPNIALKVVTAGTTTLVEKLRVGKLDAIIAFNVLDDQEITIRKSRDYEIGLIAAPGVIEPPRNASDLIVACARQPLCLPDSSLSIWPRLEAEFTRMRLKPTVMLDTNSVTLILDYIRQKKCVSFLTRLDIFEDFSEGKIRFFNVDNLRLREVLCLCTRSETHLNKLTQTVIESLFALIPQFDINAQS